MPAVWLPEAALLLYYLGEDARSMTSGSTGMPVVTAALESHPVDPDPRLYAVEKEERSVRERVGHGWLDVEIVSTESGSQPFRYGIQGFMPSAP
jgi:hypothetical protein